MNRGGHVADLAQPFGLPEQSPPTVSLKIRVVNPVVISRDTVDAEDRTPFSSQTGLRTAWEPKQGGSVHSGASESASVDFSRLRRLTIAGKSNVNDLTSNDLSALARTSNKLQELHLINTYS